MSGATTKTKLLFLVPALPFPPFGGVQRKAFDLSRALSHFADVTIGIVRRPQGSSSQSVLDRGVLYEPTWPVSIVVLTRSASVDRRARLGRFTRYQASDLAGLDTARYDIVHIDTLLLGYSVSSLMMKKAQTVLSINDSLMRMEWQRAGRVKGLARRSVQAARALAAGGLEFALSRKFDFVDVVSEGEARSLRRIGVRNVRVVPIGRPEIDPTAGVSSGRLRFGIMSPLRGENGAWVEQCLRMSWPGIHAKTGGVLRLVGSLDGVEDSVLSAVRGAPSLSLSENVVSLSEYYGGIDVALVPTRSSTGISNKTLEAVTAGVPVVAMEAGRTVEARLDTSAALQVHSNWADFTRGAVELAEAWDRGADRHALSLQWLAGWPSWRQVARQYLGSLGHEPSET